MVKIIQSLIANKWTIHCEIHEDDKESHVIKYDHRLFLMFLYLPENQSYILFYNVCYLNLYRLLWYYE